MIIDILESIITFIFEIIFQFLLFYTGEFVLFVLTFGKRKPRWDMYANEKPLKFVVFSELSVWIGAAFWLLIIGWIVGIFTS